MNILTIRVLLMLIFATVVQLAYPAVQTDSIPRNRIITWTPLMPTADADVVIDTARSIKEVQQSAQYMDGLGRLWQTVIKKGSLGKKDMVMPVLYDSMGREKYKFMPYVSDSSNGDFKSNPFNEQFDFLTSVYNPTSDINGEHFFYSKKEYEASPLERITKAFPQGNSWVGSDRGLNMNYEINSSGEVRLWMIDSTAGAIPVSSSSYAAGTLYKIVQTDEQGGLVIEYKNRQGRTVLKKSKLTGSDTKSHTGWLCTYYVYDEFNSLRFVIPPKAVDSIAVHSWDLAYDAAIVPELCYQYFYDQRGRMIIKKVPGAGETWMVYDANDRLVMTQDSNMRHNHQWQFTQYDEEGRPVTTGLITDNNHYNTLSFHLALANLSSSYPDVGNFTNSILTRTFYDDYSWIPTYGYLLSDTRITTYDSYFSSAYTSWPYPQPVTQSSQTKGLVTGIWTNILGTIYGLATVNIYDEKGRIIQTQGNNVAGGLNVRSMQYSFGGQLLADVNKIEFGGSQVTVTKNEYDDLGRLQKIKKSFNGTINGEAVTTADHIISETRYDALGRLACKTLGDDIDSLEYDYNIRGWLTGVNKNYISGSNVDHYFGMELSYDKTATVATGTSYSNPQYNGNIGGTTWKSKGDGTNRKYDFTYDSTNRLISAAFLQNTSGSSWDNSTIDFSLNRMVYDDNGNILNMTQKGFKLGSSSYIDRLHYEYENSGVSNKLKYVYDSANDTNSKLGDFKEINNNTSDDYNYDGNSNMVLDNNKNISSIVYNTLNLPEQVFMTGKGKISYVYDAMGAKLFMTVVDSTISPVKTTTTIYMADVVLQNDTIQFISTEEGRFRLPLRHYLNGDSSYGLEHDYFVKDQLGNTRILLTEQKDTARYIATMEAAYRSKEDQLFYNIPATSYPVALVSGGYPPDATTSPNDSLARTNGSGQKIGPGIVLKVMSGDVIDIATKSFYRSGGTAGGPNSALTDILNSLANAVVGMTGGSKGSLSDLNNTSGSPLYAALNSFIIDNNPTPPGKPKAYLNWILLDEQLNYVTSYPQSGAIPVSGADTLKTLAYSGIPITKSGYLYIYVSNETPNWDVFFDNLSIKHYTGPLLEETHYYPLGLPMAGISSDLCF